MHVPSPRSWNSASTAAVPHPFLHTPFYQCELDLFVSPASTIILDNRLFDVNTETF